MIAHETLGRPGQYSDHPGVAAMVRIIEDSGHTGSQAMADALGEAVERFSPPARPVRSRPGQQVD